VAVGVLISQDGAALPFERDLHPGTVGPIVVVAEHRVDRTIDPADDLAQFSHEARRVADKITGHHHQVWFRRGRRFNRCADLARGVSMPT